MNEAILMTSYKAHLRRFNSFMRSLRGEALRDLTPQLLRALHLELFKKPSLRWLLTKTAIPDDFAENLSYLCCGRLLVRKGDSRIVGEALENFLFQTSR